MTTDEINRYIHVEIMGRKEQEPDSCPICNVIHEDARQRFENADGSYPNYCSDNSPRSLLNEVVAKVGTNEVSLYLRAAPACINSTALELAEACVEAHQAK